MQADCHARSFEDVRTVDGTMYKSFAEAASAKGLLRDDHAARLTLDEAIRHSIATPYRCRVLLVQLTDAFECNLSALVEDYLTNLCENSWQRDQRRHVLRTLQAHFLSNGTSLRSKSEDLWKEAWPRADAPLLESPLPPLRRFLDDVQLSTSQQRIRDKVVHHWDTDFTSDNCVPLLLHVEAEAGSGKTFLLQHLIALGG